MVPWIEPAHHAGRNLIYMPAWFDIYELPIIMSSEFT